MYVVHVYFALRLRPTLTFTIHKYVFVTTFVVPEIHTENAAYKCDDQDDR